MWKNWALLSSRGGGEVNTGFFLYSFGAVEDCFDRSGKSGKGFWVGSSALNPQAKYINPLIVGMVGLWLAQ